MVARGPMVRVLPRIDESNEFFWSAGADEVLRFLSCNACTKIVHPPGPVCPYCLGTELSARDVSGRGTVASFTVNHQQWIPGDDTYIVAWVVIAEQDDVRLTTNLVDVDPEDVEIGMQVEVVFDESGGVYLPLFRPLRGDGAS